jgi:hypothetical protein
VAIDNVPAWVFFCLDSALKSALGQQFKHFHALDKDGDGKVRVIVQSL